MHPARPPPPFQRHWPVLCRADGTPRTLGQGDPQQTSNPNMGWGNEPLKAPRPQAKRDSSSPGHRQQPPDQPGQCATELPTLAVTRPNHRDAEDAPQQRGHDAGDAGADEETTEISCPQESGGPSPTTVSRQMSPQQEPSTGSVPEEYPDAAPGQPSRTGTTPDHERETMPPPPPGPPQRRSTNLFDGEELK